MMAQNLLRSVSLLFLVVDATSASGGKKGSHRGGKFGKKGSDAVITEEDAAMMEEDECRDLMTEDGKPWADAQEYSCLLYSSAEWCTDDSFQGFDDVDDNAKNVLGSFKAPKLGPLLWTVQESSMLTSPYSGSVSDGGLFEKWGKLYSDAKKANQMDVFAGAYESPKGKYWFPAVFHTLDGDGNGEYYSGYYSEADRETCFKYGLDNDIEVYWLDRATHNTGDTNSIYSLCVSHNEWYYLWSANYEVNGTRLPSDVACCACGGGTSGIKRAAANRGVEIDETNMNSLKIIVSEDMIEKAELNETYVEISLEYDKTVVPAELSEYPFSATFKNEPNTICTDLQLNQMKGYTLQYREKPDYFVDSAGYPCKNYAFGPFCTVDGSFSKIWKDFGDYIEYRNGVIDQTKINKANLRANEALLEANTREVGGEELIMVDAKIACCACGGGVKPDEISSQCADVFWSNANPCYKKEWGEPLMDCITEHENVLIELGCTTEQLDQLSFETQMQEKDKK